MQPRTLIAVIIGLIIIGSTYFIFTYEPGEGGNRDNSSAGSEQVDQDNVVMENGKQVINLFAKGGYAPRISLAQAGVPTILRVTTDNTFDCSSAIRIPSLKIAQNLKYSGSVDIDLGLQGKGTLDGMCGMGMYRFQVQFK